MHYLREYLILVFLQFLVYGCQNTVPPNSAQKSPTSKIEKSINTEPTSLKMLFVGDVMGHDAQIKSAYNSKTGKYNYTACFKYLEPIIAQADIAVANLEVTLPGVPPYAGYPHFRSPDELAKGLKDSGFDLVVTANNHSNDAGKIGLDHTLDALKEQNLLATGTFKHIEEREKNYPLIIDKNGFKVAFLNCTYDTNGMPDIPPSIVNRIDTSELAIDIQTAKAKNADVIVTLIHWGKEYKLLPNEEQTYLANWLTNKGVHAVIGSHPHVIQPVKTSSTNALKSEALITYSLGNFISNQRKADTEGGLLVEVEFKKNSKAELSLEKSSYTLLWRYIHQGKASKKYYTIPIAPFEKNAIKQMDMNKGEFNRMIAFASKFRKHLGKHGNVKEKKYGYEELFNNNFSKPL